MIIIIINLDIIYFDIIKIPIIMGILIIMVHPDYNYLLDHNYLIDDNYYSS